jgi:hypothetical protein
VTDTTHGTNPDWHVEPAALARYQAGVAGPAQAASVEAHLTACPRCRAALADLADPTRLARNWDAVRDRLDDRRPSFAERLLVWMGVRDDRARLVMATPALRRPSLVAVVAVLAVAVAADWAGGESAFYGFLVLAPLLPLGGVAIAFGGLSDPLGELARSTPTPAFQLLLSRALAVVATTTALTVAASAVLDRDGWRTAAWLLPALGLCAAALALSTWLPVEWAAGGLGTAWIAGAIVSWRAGPAADGVARFVAFRPSGQLVALVVLAFATLVLVGRRDSLDFGRLA